jgi:DNA-binding NarL/FixJ family response regulator
LDNIDVLIIDDQDLFAESLKYILLGEGKGSITILGMGANGKDAIELVEKKKPHLILMDIRMPVMDGVEATKIIHSRYPDIKILILTTFDDDELAYKALTNGASGYVLKKMKSADLINAIRSVHSGNLCITPSVGYRLLPNSSPSKDKSLDQKEYLTERIQIKYPNLTKKEVEIVYFVSLAYKNADIAENLYISEKTIKNHLSSIFAKLKIHSRLDLIQIVMKELLLP